MRNTIEKIVMGGIATALFAGLLYFFLRDNALEEPPEAAIAVSEEIINIADETTTRLALITNGKVVNTVEVYAGWTANSGGWQPPEGSVGILSENAGVGDTYVAGKFMRTQEAPKPELTIEELLIKESFTEEEKDRLLKYLIEKQIKL